VTESESTPARKRTSKKATAKASTAKKSPAKKSAAKKSPAKKSTAKKSPAKKSAKRQTSSQEARSAPMSKYFDRARARGRKMVDDPEALRKVADKSYRTSATRSDAFTAVLDDFRALVRLVVAYARGNYRDIPVDAMAVVVGGLLYVVSPIDLIPDTLPGGLLDDAAVIAWVVKTVREELDDFRAWELGQ
jgi:uncharacterized membrane protein YkvA (DUF1232 family)